MPNNAETPLTGVLQVGAGMEQTPPTGAPSVSGEVTPSAQTTEVQSPELQTEENTKAFVSGSAKARKLGESRKKLAETLLKNAKDSSAIREDVKNLCNSEPELDKYLQKYFKKDYEVIFKERLQEEVDHEEMVMADKAKAMARAELLVEQLREEKNEQIYDFAHQLGFTSSEASALKDMVINLEGKNIGDEELNFDEALKRAAHIIRPDKSRAGITSLPSSMPAPVVQEAHQKQRNEELAVQAKKWSGAKLQDTMKNLELVEKHYDPKTQRFQLPMD